MKTIKIFAALTLVFALLWTVGCQAKPDPEDVVSTNVLPIAENVKKGVMPEAKFALGAAVSEIDGYYKDNSSDFSFTNYIPSQENGSRGEITVDSITYYYLSNAKEKGVTAITNVGDAFGYMVGAVTTIDDIKTACGQGAVESVPTEDDVFFLYGGLPDNSKMVVFTEGENTVKFIFYNDNLAGTVLLGPDFE